MLNKLARIEFINLPFVLMRVCLRKYIRVDIYANISTCIYIYHAWLITRNYSKEFYLTHTHTHFLVSRMTTDVQSVSTVSDRIPIPVFYTCLELRSIEIFKRNKFVQNRNHIIRSVSYAEVPLSHIYMLVATIHYGYLTALTHVQKSHCCGTKLSIKIHCPTCTAFRGYAEPPVAPRAPQQTRQKFLSSSCVTYGDAIGVDYPRHLRCPLIPEAVQAAV
jgi:hypothetical protein